MIQPIRPVRSGGKNMIYLINDATTPRLKKKLEPERGRSKRQMKIARMATSAD